MFDVVEIDAATGTTTQRMFTPEEVAQREEDAEAETRRQSAAAEAAARRVALLTRLGLTEEDVLLLLSGPVGAV